MGCAQRGEICALCSAQGSLSVRSLRLGALVRRPRSDGFSPIRLPQLFFMARGLHGSAIGRGQGGKRRASRFPLLGGLRARIVLKG